MNFKGMGDSAIFKEVGRRVQRERLNQNMSQIDLALKAGVSRRALQHLENGQGCTMQSLIQVLRAFGLLDMLDSFLPETGQSPLQLAKLKGRQRMRASRPHRKNKQGKT